MQRGQDEPSASADTGSTSRGVLDVTGPAWLRDTLCGIKTATIKWQERSKSLSFLDADGRLYTHAEDGYVALVEPSPEAYREKARFMPPNRSKHEDFTALSYLALAEGLLYIREFNSLWCYDVHSSTPTKGKGR